uniref:Putative DEAD-box RNA helicase HEL64 n=1 Tax=Lygus hesperus TaxID=30085 RepID=A0A0A9VRU6_LYGHE
MGGFAGRRSGPVMRMPGGSGASFDPFGNSNSGNTKNYFGLGARNNGNSSNNDNNSVPFSSSSIQYKRFDTSSDDEVQKVNEAKNVTTKMNGNRITCNNNSNNESAHNFKAGFAKRARTE